MRGDERQIQFEATKSYKTKNGNENFGNYIVVVKWDKIYLIEPRRMALDLVWLTDDVYRLLSLDATLLPACSVASLLFLKRLCK